MTLQILRQNEHDLVLKERELLSHLQAFIANLDADESDRKALQDSILQLDQLFLLVVVGEFNAGKSAFINALAGTRVLKEGVTPTTTRIQVVQFGEELKQELEAPSIERVQVPCEALRELQIVDTPGTNAILREHEALTREFVPRSDLVLFVTSADRPFTESERSFLETIRQWGKKVVVVINKIDILERPEDVRQVRDFVRNHLQLLLDFEPQVFTVSARDALQRKLGPESAQTHPQDEFGNLEAYIHQTLDQAERLRLKLLNPLGVGINLASRYLEEARAKLQLLREDLRTLREIDSQLEMYQEDMNREFQLRLAEVDKILHAFENRGIAFFDDRMRLGRVFDLLNKSRMKADFETNVIGQVPKQIEDCVNDLIDWMLSSEIRQWEQIREHLAEGGRHRQVPGRAAAFDQDRRRLLESVGKHAQEVLEKYDRERESNRMAEDLQKAVAGTALVEVGALGLGALVTALATTTLADITGLVAAGTVAVVGLFVIPARRREAKRQLRDRIQQMRRQLMEGLTSHFQREQKNSLHRIREGVAPFSRFVRAEQAQLEERRQVLENWLNEAKVIQHQVEAL